MNDIPISAALFATPFLIFLIWYGLFHLRRRGLYKIAAHYNGPKAWPVIGNALKCRIPLTNIADAVLDGTSYYKSPARLWMGPYLAIAVWDPESIRIVTNSSHALEKEPFMYRLLKEVAGPGIINSPVDEWKRHRKLIAPIFNKKFLESFFDMFLAHSRELVNRLQGRVDKGIFNVQAYVADYSMESVIDTILDFGDGNACTHDAGKLKEFMGSMFQAITFRLTKIWYISDFLFNRSSTGREFANTKANFHALMDSIIEKCIKDYEKKIMRTKVDISVSEPRRPKRLMEYMLSVSDGKGKLTLEELKREIKNIMVAALETTSSTLGYLLLVLGMFPEVQDKVYQEVIQVLGAKKQLEYKDLTNLVYMKRVIKETMRILPGTFGIARRNSKDIQLEDHIIPANSTILIAIMALHRNPNIWSNPTKFDPDRFLPEEEAKRHPYSWIPFSAGPRNCVGMRFAWMSFMIALSTLILNYKVITDYKSIEDVKLTAMVVLEPTDGYKIGISRR